MVDVRVYMIGERCVVKVRGDLDGAAIASLGAREAAVIDLRDARLVDPDALDTLVERTDAIFVAARPLRDALELIALHRPVRTAPTLAAALA